MKIQLTLNTEHPYKNYLENKKGERLYFNPHKPKGEYIYDFLMDAEKISE